MLPAINHGNRSIIPLLKSIRFKPRSTASHEKLLQSSLHSLSSNIIFSGIQPTGIPHLGNYLGALQQWVRLQNEAPPNTQFLFSIVDLHAITVNQDAQQLHRWKRQTLATLLAVGLDPERVIIFYQSSVWPPDLEGHPQRRTLVDLLAGTSPYGAHVDPQLHCLYWLSVKDDTMEGERDTRGIARRELVLRIQRPS